MFYVYHGYVNSDNCDASEGPIFKLSQFETEKQLLAFKEDFEESVSNECSHAVFRVIQGLEREMVPVEKITKWRLS